MGIQVTSIVEEERLFAETPKGATVGSELGDKEQKILMKKEKSKVTDFPVNSNACIEINKTNSSFIHLQKKMPNKIIQ